MIERLINGLHSDERGTAGVEFALLSPILLFILAGTIDFGLMIYTSGGLDKSVAEVTNYAIVHGSSASSAGGAALAAKLLAIAPAAVDISVVVNGGPQLTRINGAVTTAGTVSTADVCHCPTSSNGTVTWGGALTCGAACSGGGVAGKFVYIAESVPYSPLFGDYGFVKNHSLFASSLVQVQ
ncbi:MAG TPA: TadE/TadG family type IV pilus assembly protein [Devosiaceae bacterium]|nr:TadE/TadG family type IV pilus assembly protein [Devosiaceae bacterium]